MILIIWSLKHANNTTYYLGIHFYVVKVYINEWTEQSPNLRMSLPMLEREGATNEEDYTEGIIALVMIYFLSSVRIHEFSFYYSLYLFVLLKYFIINLKHITIEKLHINPT